MINFNIQNDSIDFDKIFKECFGDFFENKKENNMSAKNLAELRRERQALDHKITAAEKRESLRYYSSTKGNILIKGMNDVHLINAIKKILNISPLGYNIYNSDVENLVNLSYEAGVRGLNIWS